jgi:predicted kinase
MIIIVFGLPGSGKSYFAEKLALEIGAEHINSDRLRKDMFEKRTYTESEKQAVYEEMLQRMELALKENRDLVLDATFYKESLRRQFIEAAGATGILFMEVQAPENLIRERLSKKREDSEADYEVYKIVRSQWEPMREQHLKLESGNNNLAAMLRRARNYIEKQGS